MALLTVDEAAQRLSTKPRFVRRLIAEKRIAYVKLGGHVRIEDSAVQAFIEAGRVAPMSTGAEPSTDHMTELPQQTSRHHADGGRSHERT
jgi:excisionase family DNA binding protein